jgi:proline racemase
MIFTPNVKIKNFQHSFQTIETHTAGEPTRIIVAGFPAAEGGTMMERKEYYEKNNDAYRQALMAEPRGHHDMVGALLMEPVNPAADFGIIFMDTNRWINMCGHATMGCATAAVEAGLVPVKEPYTEIEFDTPAGMVHTTVKVRNGKAIEVTIENVPSFLYADNIIVNMDGKEISVEISFGGSFFALVDVSKIGYELTPQAVPELTQFGMKLLRKLNDQVIVTRPKLGPSRVGNCEFYAPSDNKGSDQCNMVCSEQGMVDRSPCGTGTSAKMAALYAKGKLDIGEPFVNENFMGARFRGEIRSTASIGVFKGILPAITGSAYLCGMATHLIDPQDPMKYGFLIG